MEVDDCPESCTMIIKKVVVNATIMKQFPQFNGHRVLLVDTPGFNRTEASDSETPNGCELGGVIFLHDISNDRVTGINFVGDSISREFATLSVVLGFTKGAKISSQKITHRIDNLKEGYWKDVIVNGAIVERIDHRNDSESARAVIQAILRAYLDKCARKIVIPVVGMAGAGKSTLINTILETQNAEVRRDNGKTCTRETKDYTSNNIFWYHRSCIIHSVVFVDTPGFVDPIAFDATVHSKSTEHADKLAAAGFDFGGVIYVHDLTSENVPDAWSIFLYLFEKYKSRGASNIAIVATKGGNLRDTATSTQRLKTLEKNQWKQFILRNSQVFEVEKLGHPSIQAREIVDAILERYQPTRKSSTDNGSTSLWAWSG
ncbi:hypothetical protein JR316_0000035 [Psilocybe cubensis]|uniref:Uncharacterized protein n=1 Tax=Psilocybe cubensis TaxID=181762 RepID=A0ACB8HD88_PSICU|nr:hypothetical protein JR316_0000035 [Psilocybe cubensis]KAH9485973.1 hypothetical protein JR316_0000035 [Psilocybe cubensis]